MLKLNFLDGKLYPNLEKFNFFIEDGHVVQKLTGWQNS